MWYEKEFLEIFTGLARAEYYWEPMTPDRTIRARKNPEQFRPIQRVFGLGLSVPMPLIVEDGLPNKADIEALESPLCITRASDLGFLVHDFWPQKKGVDYIHLGPESFYLAREFEKEKEKFSRASVIDLGCSSGILSFAAARLGAEVLGVDISARSIEVANSIVRIKSKELELKNKPLFFCQDVLTKDFLKWCKTFEEFQFAVFNPPLGISGPLDVRRYRDGGKYGIEIPLKFLEVANALLKKSGEAWFIIANPYVRGKKIFDDKLKSLKSWQVLHRRVLETKFNQAVAVEQGYAKLGIDSIDLELWKLQKTK